jgi:putative Holliday junction resolvase
LRGAGRAVFAGAGAFGLATTFGCGRDCRSRRFRPALASAGWMSAAAHARTISLHTTGGSRSTKARRLDVMSVLRLAAPERRDRGWRAGSGSGTLAKNRVPLSTESTKKSEFAAPYGGCYPRGMRIAALDVGDARIGVAVSDELGLTVRGVGVVKRVGGRRDLEALARVLEPLAPGRLVVGLPLNMDGTEGPRATKTRAFGERAAAHLALPVEFWDERLTTFEAEQLLREAGVPPRRRRARIDAAAASVILRDYLAARR